MSNDDIEKKIKEIGIMGRAELESISKAVCFSPLPSEAKKALQKAIDNRYKSISHISPEAVSSEMTYD